MDLGVISSGFSRELWVIPEPVVQPLMCGIVDLWEYSSVIWEICLGVLMVFVSYFCYTFVMIWSQSS